MFYPIIREARKRLETVGYYLREWRMKDLRRVAGISYGLVKRLEYRREIAPIKKDGRGRLFWTPADVYDLLLTVETNFLMKEIRRV